MSTSSRRPWVYISSPYTKGDVAINVRAQMDTADLLLDLGMVPIVPLYSHFQHIFRPRPYEEWIALDLEIVSRCDVCLRIAAEYEDGKGMAYRQWDSSGADREVEEFERLGKPVLFTIEDVQQWAAAWRTGFRTSNDAATRDRDEARTSELFRRLAGDRFAQAVTEAEEARAECERLRAEADAAISERDASRAEAATFQGRVEMLETALKAAALEIARLNTAPSANAGAEVAE